jgi:hypothetical protein
VTGVNFGATKGGAGVRVYLASVRLWCRVAWDERWVLAWFFFVTALALAAVALVEFATRGA